MRKPLHVAVVAALALSLAATTCIQIGRAQSAGAQNATARSNKRKNREPGIGVATDTFAMLFLAGERTSPSDLELVGDFAGLPPHSTRYISRQTLLETLPQVSYTVTNDANFSKPMQISGVALEELVSALNSKLKSAIAVAICSDGYETHYTHSYISAHHPVLVLKIDGKDPADWPKFHESGADMGPYLISSPDFKPSFTILSHEDEPQIPWGVVRLKIQSEAVVLDAIRPRGANVNSREVQDGYRIAQQNCFRCHNSGNIGGTKAQRPWSVLSTWATASPEFFQAYIHDPKSKNPKAQMPGFPNYDEATLNALTKYFQTFADTKSKP
jgi:mono/diheme cytochrome c family protein